MEAIKEQLWHGRAGTLDQNPQILDNTPLSLSHSSNNNNSSHRGSYHDHIPSSSAGNKKRGGGKSLKNRRSGELPPLIDGHVDSDAVST